MRAAGTVTQEYFDTDYFDWQAVQAVRSARVVVPLLLELTGATSVFDLGGGTGAWASVFVEHGVEDVVVADGDHVRRDRLLVPEECFAPVDLAHLLMPERQFDLALCLEAAHYAPEGAATAIVSHLTQAAPIVYFSAAVPGQPGGPARNLQWPHYWSERFAANGHSCADVLRPLLWEEPDVDWWYAQNSLLFVSDGARLAPTGAPLPLVHPGLLAEVSRAAEPDADLDPDPDPDVRPRGLAGLLRRIG